MLTFKRVAKVFFLAVAMFAPTTSIAVAKPASPAPDAAALMAKFRTFMGWTLGDGSVLAIRIKGRIADQSTFDEICEPSRFAQFSVGTASGRSFLVESGPGWGWVSHAGQPNDLPAAMAADAFTEGLLLCNAFTTAYPAVALTIDTKGSKGSRGQAILVGLSIPNEPTVFLQIDKQTGALITVIVDNIATYRPAGLKDIGGGRKIYTIWKRETSDTTTADMVISSIQLNVTVDPKIFYRTALDAPPPPDPAPTVNLASPNAP